MIHDRSLAATWRRLPAPGAFSGMTSFSLHGLDVDPCDPLEATSPIECKLVGVNLRRAKLPEEDVVVRRGMRTTTVPRTLADLCIRLDLTDAVAMADMALHAGLTNQAELAAWVRSHHGRQGIKRLRRVVAFAEPAAESPMESRLRMLLVLNRLPRPKAQVCIQDTAGRLVGRVDLYCESWRLAIEYDGARHRESLTEDNRRQNRLLSAGVRLLRFTAADVLGNPASVVGQVRAAIGTKLGVGLAANAAFGTKLGAGQGVNAAFGTKRGRNQMKTIAS